jgi:REP element-mobilizing transposase RayT
LAGYDYSKAGVYFITICTHNRECLFGGIVDGEMLVHEFGSIVSKQWDAIPERFPCIELDAFTVMPNHIHGIIFVGAPLAGARFYAGAREDMRATARVAPTVGEIIGAYKSLSMYYCLKWVKQNEPQRYLGKLWQRNYYEHIIRDDDDLNRTREYILCNPANWQDDDEYKLCPSLTEEKIL